MYRINELDRVVKDWKQATALKYASPSDPWKALGRSDKVEDLWKMGERMLLMGTSRRKERADWDM